MRIKSCICAAALLVFGSGGVVLAQGFGGSFEDTSAVTATGAGQPAAGTDSFGGSFQNTAPVAAEPAPAPAPPPDPQDTAIMADQPAERFIVDVQIFAFESRDYGVAPTDRLRASPMHAATPVLLPGGQLVSTQGLADALGEGIELVLIDVLGAPYMLPGSYSAPRLAEPGHYSDNTQQSAEHWLDRVTGGRKDLPIVIYCSDPQCWLSYNASLRTIAAGYTAVYWYRGGLQAWEMAGLGMEPSGF